MSDREKETKIEPEVKYRDVLQVTLDTPFETVLEWDRDGARLSWERFCEREAKMPSYSEDDINKLSKHNRTSYMLSLGEYTAAKKSGPRASPNLKVSGRLVDATTKLTVNYPKGWKEKWHPVWQRADEIHGNARAGYVPVNVNDVEDAGVEPFQTNPQGYPVIKTNYEDELILMKEPVEQNDERIRQVSDKSRALNRSVQDDAAEEIKRQGGVPYIPQKGDDRKYDWREVKKPEEQ